ncbi:DUF421 domain-containing protein [Pseudoneobacillus sp. C159]
MINVGNLTIEILVGFFTLFIIINFVGRKIISQITPFTFISSVVLSELLGNALYDNKVNALHIIYAMVLWGILLFVVEWIGRKSLFFLRIFQGKPACLINNGVIDREMMKKCRMNLTQLQSMLRQSETFSIRQVAYCYLEPSGAISILKKPEYKEPTLGDLKIEKPTIHVPVTLIRDGKLLKKELAEIGKDEDWLKAQLESQNLNEYKDVFLAEWQEGEGIFAQAYMKPPR